MTALAEQPPMTCPPRRATRWRRGIASVGIFGLILLPASTSWAGQRDGRSNAAANQAGQVAIVANPDALAERDAVAVLGPRFAGTWVDPESGRRQIAATGFSDLERLRLAQSFKLYRFDLVRATWSEPELAAVVRLVQRDLHQYHESTYMVGINIPANRVDLTIGPQSAALPAMRQVEARGRHSLSIHLGIIAPTYQITDRGGVREWTRLSATSYSACTTGFTLQHPTYGRVMSTAGHCASAASGQQIFNSLTDNCSYACTSGPTVGSVILRRDPDVLIYSRNGAVGKVWNGTGYVSVRGSEDPQWLEHDVCFRGASSVGQHCGPISSVNYAMSYVDSHGKHWSYQAYCISGGHAIHGDSGSASYKYRTASDVNAKGLITSSITYGNGTITACGTTISNVLNSTGAHLVKG